MDNINKSMAYTPSLIQADELCLGNSHDALAAVASLMYQACDGPNGTSLDYNGRHLAALLTLISQETNRASGAFRSVQ